jgi:predicted DNA-binding transcriptional regulator AlpA
MSTALEELMHAALAAAPTAGTTPSPSCAANWQRSTRPRPPPHEPYLTLREVGQRLGISSATLWRWQVPGHSLGGRRRFRLSEVEAYLKTEAFERRAAALRADRKHHAKRGGDPKA